MFSDIEISQQNPTRKVVEVASKLGLAEDALIPYGHYKAKIDVAAVHSPSKPEGKLILVTAISPTQSSRTGQYG